jgi:hypothetical protein
MKSYVRTANRLSSLAGSVEKGLGNARAVLGDPRVHEETKALLSDLTDASRRARKIGLGNAFGDKLVAKRLSNASHHGSRALDAARGRRRRRNAWWRTVAATAGVGVTLGSIYGAWRMHARTGSSR